MYAAIFQEQEGGKRKNAPLKEIFSICITSKKPASIPRNSETLTRLLDDPKDNRKLIVENKRRLCGGFAVNANQAIIVAHDGGIHIAPDTSSPWVDTNGDDHFQINRAHMANGSVQTIWVKSNTDREYIRQELDKLPERIEEGLVSRQELLFSVVCSTCEGRTNRSIVHGLVCRRQVSRLY